MKSALAEVVRLLGKDAGRITTKELIVGINYTAVRLSSDDIGLANTPLQEFSPESCALPSRAGTLTKIPTARLARFSRSWDLSERVTGVAALNALSQMAMRTRGGGVRKEYGDVIGLTRVEKSDTVVMVGNMRHSADKLRRKAKRVLVLERSTGLRDEYTLPDTAVEEVVPQGDVVFATGATLCNGTADRIIELSRGAREVVMLGPSAGIFPPALFKRGVTAVAPMEILDADGAMRSVREGGGTSALHRSAREVVYRPVS
jgi:hypothetical protein